MPKSIKSINIVIHGCFYILTDTLRLLHRSLQVYKYPQHGVQMSVFKYEEHLILNKHIERLQPLEHI